MPKQVKEASYYPAVKRFLEKMGYVCEAKGRDRDLKPFITKGIRQIIIDVFGIRSVQSRYSNAFEIAAVEVKRNTRRTSLRSMNQAFNNSKLAHYCYLAMPRRYSANEIAAAADLGIGLLQIVGGDKVQIVSQGRRFQPDPALSREFFRRRLAIGQCSICQTFVSLYDIPSEQREREGGGWRKNVFATKDKWVYFCPQCRHRFENVFTERKMLHLEKRIKTLEAKIKTLRSRSG